MWTLSLTSLVLLLLCASAAAQCPQECICFNFNPAGTQFAVDCRGRGLRAVPKPLPPATIHLDVGDNEIAQIRTGDFAGLTQLLYLHLQNNRISSIEDGSFSQLGRLQVLNLYDNNIAHFENGTFTGLGRLKQLEAYNIGLRSIQPGAFSPLQSATIMNLDQNSLVLLTAGTFDSLPLLTRVSIRNGFITAVEKLAFNNLPRLAYLHLGNNRIRTVGEMAFVGIPALRVIFFDNNDYTCDCESLWLWELMRERPTLGPGPRCSQPDQLRDFSLQHLQSEDQLCPQPEVHVKVSHRYIFPGDEVQLVCESSGLVRPLTYWSREGRLVSTRKDYSFEENKLVIRNISVLHQGRYYCAASNRVDGVASSGVDVYLSGLGIRAPVFDTTQIMRTVFEGENVVFDCDPRLDTTEGLTIGWTRTDALPLPAGHVITSNNSLMLLNVMTSDEGTYRCTATNVLGTAFLDYRLEVEIPIASRAPTIDKTNGSLLLTFARGTRGEIDCFVMSESLFTIDWFLDGWPIRDALFDTEYEVLNDGQTLVIPNADIRHAGNYMCLVTNEAGLARLQAVVEVTQPPFFRTQPSDIGVPPTTAAQFFCSGGGSPQPTVQWFHISNKTGVEQQLQTSGDVFLSDERLIILHARSSDEGFYYCKVVSPLGEITSRQGFLTVYTPPTFSVTNLPTIVTVSEFDRVELPCTASGRPAPDVTWSKQGSSVGEVEGGRVIKLDSGTLEIGNAARDDEGEYKCRVANAAGEQFHTIRLNVTTRPMVNLQPDRVIAEVGEPVRFSCLVSGFPTPETMWLFKGRIVTENDRVVVTRTGDLLITSLSPWDEGYYSCLARNAEGQAEDLALLEVVGFKGNTSEPVINNDFTTFPSTSPGSEDASTSVPTVTRSEGDEVTFLCLADGVPTPTVQWERTIGNEAVAVTPTTGVRIDEVGVLRILDLQPSDEGFYSCDVKNSEGNVRQSYLLIIQKPPEVTLPPITPHVDPGGTILLTCQATGTPKPEINWLLNNREIIPETAMVSNGKDIIIEEGQLQITNADPKDSGEYTCLASNNAGRASHSIKITVTENDEPRFVTRPVSQIVAVGADIILDCLAEGTPEIVQEWQKDGVGLATDNRLLIEMYPSGVVSIIIRGAELEDSGRYSCFTFNSFGTAEYEVEVFVTASNSCIPVDNEQGVVTNIPLPEVDRFPSPQTIPQEGSETPIYGDDGSVRAQVGQTMRLNCADKVTGHLNHYWLHNNSEVVIDNTRVQAMDNGTLVIQRISFRDGGDYECIYTTADPFQGVLINTYSVKVAHASSQPSINEELVEFVIKPENQTVIAGSTAVISCEAHFEGRELDTTWQRGDRMLSKNSVLVIPRVTMFDSGEYECVVADTERKNSTFITVHVPPVFTTKPQDVEVDASSPPLQVTFNCRAEGVPSPTYVWQKGNSSISFHSSQYQLLDGGHQLVIQPPFNDGLTGRYTCIVFNSVGSAEASAMLQITNQAGGSSEVSASCNCQLKTRQRIIVVGNCVSFNQHNENYCDGYCATTAFPAYSSADDTHQCCYPGTDSVRQLIPMQCTESGHIINKAVQVEAVRSCQCQLC